MIYRAHILALRHCDKVLCSESLSGRVLSSCDCGDDEIIVRLVNPSAEWMMVKPGESFRSISVYEMALAANGRQGFELHGATS